MQKQSPQTARRAYNPVLTSADGLASPSATAVRRDRLYITDGGVPEPTTRNSRRRGSTSLLSLSTRHTESTRAVSGAQALAAMEERLVRYTKEHKQETRRRIVETAGRRLKRDGIDGSGVATLMKDAGLTNGTFYAYFASKDELVATAVADQMRTQHESIVAQAAPGRAGLEQLICWYFSTEQRDNVEDGCPNAALLDEIGRSTDPTRQAYTDGALVLIDGFAARLAPHDPPSARLKSLSLLGMMAGTLQLSRALTDRQLADQLLEQGIHNALALLDAEQHD